MSVIVTDDGFAPDDFAAPILPLDAAGGEEVALDLPNTADPEGLRDRLGRIALIRIAFPAFTDGRGFTLARRLRLMGYAGRLRAHGPLIADQYAMARRAGFDEVEIPDAIAARQPEVQWRARGDWRAHDYQSRLRGVSPRDAAV
ncbi:MAG: DUF934 domain-containing protein [Gemmobacter sp.]